MVEVRFLDDRVPPNDPHQIALADDLTAEIDQRDQGFYRLRRQDDVALAAVSIRRDTSRR